MFDINCFTLRYDNELCDFVLDKKILSGRTTIDYNDSIVCDDGICIKLDKIKAISSEECLIYSLSSNDSAIELQLKNFLTEYNKKLILRSKEVIKILAK